jgi:Zn finger protein HypA/HybF involved in hydrogenase expression
MTTKTAISNPYDMEPTTWRGLELVEIRITPAESTARCHRCGMVTPETIVTPHLDKPLHRCPKCRSVIQDMEGGGA